MHVPNNPVNKMNTKTRNKFKGSLSEKDDLILRRKGGGSIIDQRPLFSQDGETLYIVWKQVIRAYSTQTGDFVREFEAVDHKISDITTSPDNSNSIIGCTDNGELITWNCQNGIVILKVKLQMTTNKNIKVKTFHIIHYKTEMDVEVRYAMITYNVSHGSSKSVCIETFDLKTGKRFHLKRLNDVNENYKIDIIGNSGENLVAICHETYLFILNPMYNMTHLRHNAGRTLTCIAGHPTEEGIATGDTSGRVLVWRNVLTHNRTVRGTYHWHTLPVTEIVFSKSGAYMYTGGGECVLVKWVIANPAHKSFLPRLPAPIRHLTIAPENIYVAVSTLDNGILIVNPHRKLTSVIQNFTWGVGSSSGQTLFPAGLTVDPRTNSLVLNSRTGHVQFYDAHNKSLLYNVNITAQNIISRERNSIIVNTEVTKLALNHDGTWMATMEERDDKVSNTEVRLKFWHFDVEKQIFVLNTSLELPHEDGVNVVRFQPNTSLSSNEHFAVTTGKDKKFKLWYLAEPTSIHKKGRHWQCYSFGYYHDLPATDAGFSTDGSLLGVGFGSSLTIWNPESTFMKCSLSHMLFSEMITRVEFGKQEACHLVVIGSPVNLAVWNLLTLKLMWIVPLNLATLAADPLSTYMAVFTSDNTLFVFVPGSSNIIYTRKNVTEKDTTVLGAAFVPHLQEKRHSDVKSWQKKSQLYFLDADQELLTLESPSEAEITLENLSSSGTLPATAFGRLLAAKSVSDTDKIQPIFHEYLGVTGKGMIDQLLLTPSHTLPHMRLLCGPFITSLLSSKSDERPKEENRERDEDYDEKDEESDDSEDEKPKTPLKRKETKESRLVSCSPTDNNNINIVQYNWDFLSAILPSAEGVSTG